MASDEKITYTRMSHMEKEAIGQDRRRSVPDKVAKHANDADEAMKAFAGHEGELLELDEATSKRLLRKIDLHLMPVSIPYRRLCEHPAQFFIASVRYLWPELSRQYDFLEP